MAESPFPRVSFIGGGKMATAMIKGLLATGLTTAGRLVASDSLETARQALAASTGIEVLDRNADVVGKSDIIILAVKPQVMKSVLAEIKPALLARHLVISVAAGISIRQLEQGIGEDRRIIRVMPNTPALVGAGAAAYSPGPRATPEDIALTQRILESVGRAYRLPEHLLDAVTGLSASGPGFVAVMIEALSDGGVRVGLSRDVATALAAQTVLGTAKMVLEEGLHPALIKEMVASPGGTTIAGLHALERGGLRAALIDAVEAAARRSQELGQSQ